MMTKTFISALALALTSVLSFAGPAFAQDHMIEGKAVPADQVEAVQAKCDELRDAAAGSAAPAPDAPAPAPDAPATTDATTSTDTAADTPTPSTDTTATTTTTTDASAEAVIELETLTIAMCDEGGFTATTP